MSRKATVDPVEAAKLQRQKAHEPAPLHAPVPAIAPVASPAPVAALPPTPLAAATPAPVPAVQQPTAAATPAIPTKARVKVAKVASIRGQVIRLKIGDIIADESFGPGTVARLLGSGIELEILG